MHWQHTDSLNLNAVSFAGDHGWAVGPKGAIARFKTHFSYQVNNAKPAPNNGYRTSIETSSPSCFPFTR